MNPFIHPDLTRFFADLISAIEAAPSPKHKVSIAVAKLDLFLDARSYAIVATQKERLNKQAVPGRKVSFCEVPYPVFVRIQNNGNNLLGHFGRWPSSEKTDGFIFSHTIDDNYSLIVEGAGELFAREPFLKDMCIHIAEHLAGPLNQLKLPSQQDYVPGEPNGKTARAAPFLDASINSFLDWSPIAQAFKTLGDTVGHCNIAPSQLRWVWVSRSFNSETSFPYIYMQEADSDNMPEPFNKSGSKGIIHGILETKTPQLIWNYVYSREWNHPDEMREKFIRQANPEDFPHMIYFPVMERLAAQITFGPRDDLMKLLNAGNQLVELAPLILLYGFQEVIYASLLELLWDCHFDKGTSGVYESQGLLKFIADSCPIPPVKVVESKSGLLEIQPVSEVCQMAKAFAEHTNSAIKHAQETALKMSETEDYKIFAANVMGMTHTLERPLDNMKSYVQSVAMQKNLSQHLTNRSSEMLSFLDGIKVFARLEIEAFKDAFPSEDKSISGVECSAEEILTVLSKANYDPVNLCYEKKGRFPQKLLLSDPIRREQIRVRRNLRSKYPAAAGPLALIIAELIDNAAKHKSPKDTIVDLSFNQKTIIIGNDIDDRADVEDRLNEGSKILIKSLGRIHHVARMIRFRINPMFPTSTRLEFEITPK